MLLLPTVICFLMNIFGQLTTIFIKQYILIIAALNCWHTSVYAEMHTNIHTYLNILYGGNSIARKRKNKAKAAIPIILYIKYIECVYCLKLITSWYK